MNNYNNCVLRFLRDEDGPTAVEYAIMLAMIIGVCLVGIGLAGDSVSESFQFSFNQMDAAINGSGGTGGSGSGSGSGSGTGTGTGN